jgi:tetratricopeptide (TPR) repeat protein
LFVSGVQAQKTGQLDAAERAFQRVLLEGGKVSFVYNNLGIVYQQRREHPRAVTQFREAIRLQPDYAAPRILMGASLLALGKVEEAIRELERAVKLQPREPLARLQLARAYQQADNFMGMVEEFQVLRELAPRDPEYAYQLGNAYMKLSLWCHQKIRQLNPRSARVYQTLGENYILQGQTEQAARAYQLAVQADPKLPGLHLALAQIYLGLGKGSEARNEVEQELTIVPESVAAFALKGRLEAGESKP